MIVIHSDFDLPVRRSTQHGVFRHHSCSQGLRAVAVGGATQVLQFNAQARLIKHGVGYSQYKHYMHNIEENSLEIISIEQRIEYKRSQISAEDNPIMPASKKNAGQLLIHLADDRTDIPSCITDDRG